MKSYYVYLAKFKSSEGVEYWYVGSHSWNGPEGVIDITYNTSSRIAKEYRWRWIDMSILEICSNLREVLLRERYWINTYAEKYGISDVAYNKASLHKGNIWIKKWKRGGMLLNCHDNSCEHATEAARLKTILYGMTEKQRAHVNELQENIKEYIRMAHTPEALKKAVDARDYKEIHRKANETKLKSRIKYEVDGCFIGDFEEIAKYLGCCKENASKWLRGYQDLPKRCGIHSFKIV